MTHRQHRVSVFFHFYTLLRITFFYFPKSEKVPIEQNVINNGIRTKATTFSFLLPLAISNDISSEAEGRL